MRQKPPYGFLAALKLCGRAVCDSRLSSEAADVLVMYAGYSDKNGYLHPSQSTIAKALGVTRQCVQYHLKKLEMLEFLSSERTFDNSGAETSKTYKLNFDLLKQPLSHPRQPRSVHRAARGHVHEGANPTACGPCQPQHLHPLQGQELAQRDSIKETTEEPHTPVDKFRTSRQLNKGQNSNHTPEPAQAGFADKHVGRVCQAADTPSCNLSENPQAGKPKDSSPLLGTQASRNNAVQRIDRDLRHDGKMELVFENLHGKAYRKALESAIASEIKKRGTGADLLVRAATVELRRERKGR